MDQNQQGQPSFGQLLVNALVQFFYMIAFILFLCPFGFWKNACIKLDEARKNKAWNFGNSKSHWPFLSFLKAILFNFIFDGLIFISYFVGIIMAFKALFSGGGFWGFLLTLIISYYAPMAIAPLRDIVYLLILPITKLIKWCSRPPQYLEIDMTEKQAR